MWHTHTANRCSSQLIPCGSQQDLGSSVPPRRHVLRQCRIPAVLLDLVEWSGQAEITQLDYTVSVQQHVGRLWETQTRETFLTRTITVRFSLFYREVRTKVWKQKLHEERKEVEWQKNRRKGWNSSLEGQRPFCVDMSSDFLQTCARVTECDYINISHTIFFFLRSSVPAS